MFNPIRSIREASRRRQRRNAVRLEPLEDRQLMAVMLHDAGSEFSGSQESEFSQLADIQTLGDPNRYTNVNLVEIPPLSSLPGAPVSLNLDFDGHPQAGNVIGGVDHVDTPPFNVVGTPKDDNDPSRFSKKEQDVIRAVWAIVAEDFAPFNINVTTVEPTDATRNLRVAIGGDGLWYKGGEAGGASEIGSFTNNAPNIAYVFPVIKPGLPGAGTTAKIFWIGNAVSHEAGHSFGLLHQSRGVDTPFGFI